jgi:glycosyltransferase involved in cell wall biosynthesis
VKFVDLWPFSENDAAPSRRLWGRRPWAFELGKLALLPTQNLRAAIARLRRAEDALARAEDALARAEDALARAKGAHAVAERERMRLQDALARWESAWLLPSGFLREQQHSRSQSRSVVFLGNCYYNFFYLAAALRRRGWDALSVSVEAPDGPHARFYHGEDLCLFDPDPQRFRRNIEEFYSEVVRRFRMVHFYGRGWMSFFPERMDALTSFSVLPVDFLLLKQLGVKLGYSISGCLDGVAQSTVNAWSRGVCDRCVWQHDRNVCGDLGNLAWGHKIEMFCDVIATEGFPALDWQGSRKAYREPLTTALDPDLWRPDLEIPEQFRLQRAPGELIVYHSFGNFELRSRGGRNIKGTPAVLSAIERLRAEGMNVRLEFVKDMSSRDVRFIQVQADVIVDQLNHGRYGATAREGMMLGRPTVCHINRDEPPGAERLESIETCPLVSANEDTIYSTLKDLLSDEGKRRMVATASRAFALKWHSADACAERFERVYDRLMQGRLPSEAQELGAAQ